MHAAGDESGNAHDSSLNPSRRVYPLFDPQDQNSTASLSVNLIVIVVIIVVMLANIFTMVLETAASLATGYAKLFWAIELLAVIFFSFEYLAYW